MRSMKSGPGRCSIARVTVSHLWSRRYWAWSPSNCSTEVSEGSVAVAIVSPHAKRRSVWIPHPNLPVQPPPSSTVGADGTPAHPWRAAPRGRRRDLGEQECRPPGHGGVVADPSAGRGGGGPGH